MSSGPTVPKAAAARLSLYLRHLDHLLKAKQETVSSRQLGEALELSDAKVRKDLTYFGQFGHPGVGYRVAELRDALRAVMGTHRTWRVAMVGVGNLGRALLGYPGFSERGFQFVALFDTDPELVGSVIREMKIHHLDNLPQIAGELRLELAVLAVPADAADGVARRLVKAGIVGILNFAPVTVTLPKSVAEISVDLAMQLEQLAFRVTRPPG